MEAALRLAALVVTASVLTGSAALADTAVILVTKEPASDKSGIIVTHDLASALDALKRQRRQEPQRAVEVRIEPGLWRVTQPLALVAEHSGSPEAKVTFRPDGSGEVVLSGALAVDGWHRPDDDDLTLFPALARDDLLVVDLNSKGFPRTGNLEMKRRGNGRSGVPAHPELIYRGGKLLLTRWPNSGFLRLVPGKLVSPTQMEFASPPAELPASFAGAWAHGYWAYDWADDHLPVAHVDPKSRLATLAAVPVPSPNEKARFYFENAPAFLDRPGEWWFDPARLKVFLDPPRGFDEDEIELTWGEHLLVANDVHDIVFDGVSFEGTRGDAVIIKDAARVTLQHCRIRNVGDRAIVLAGSDNIVRGCMMSALGDGAIDVDGGDRRSLRAGNNIITENDIHDFAQWTNTNAPGISMHGVGNRVTRNTIHDAPHMGIIIDGNDQVVAGNRLYRLLKDQSDAGAIYTSRDLTARGNKIVGNLVCAIGGSGKPSVFDIYLDNMASGYEVADNILLDGTSGVFSTSGSDNMITGNVIKATEHAIVISDWSTRKTLQDVFYSRSWRMQEKMDMVLADLPPYSERYPGLRRPQAAYLHPQNNVIAGNLFIGMISPSIPSTIKAEQKTFGNSTKDGLKAALNDWVKRVQLRGAEHVGYASPSDIVRFCKTTD